MSKFTPRIYVVISEGIRLWSISGWNYGTHGGVPANSQMVLLACETTPTKVCDDAMLTSRLPFTGTVNDPMKSAGNGHR